jgi:hypothetical protein
VPPHSTSLKTHLIIILPSTPGSSKRSLSFRFRHQNPVHNYTHPIRTTCRGLLILYDFITRTILGEEHRLLSSSLYSCFVLPCYLLTTRIRYSSQHPILKRLQPTILSQYERPCFIPIHNNRQNCRYVNLNH